MSLLVKLVYDTSKVRCRYTRVHDRTFGFGAWGLTRVARLQGAKSSHQDLMELDELETALDGIRSQLADLHEEDLTKRRGREIRDALSEYSAALEDSVLKLRMLCRSRQEAKGERKRQIAANLPGYREHRIAYDDSIQHHKRLGERLTDLLSTF